MLAFYRAVRRHPDWQKPRRFRVQCGGFGLQNPFPVLEYVDMFWFGRCEDEFVNTLTIKDYEHESLMYSDRPKVCRIHQVDSLYPHRFRLHTDDSVHNDFAEKIMGCPNKCLFCHFSFSRRHINTTEHYGLNNYNKATQELDMFNLEDIRYDCPKTTMGLDGVSERLRYLVNKPIPDSLLRQTIVNMSQRSTITGQAFYLQLYNITGYETETQADYETFVDVIRSAVPDMRKRCILILHTTPLHPSPATPLVYAPVRLDTIFERMRGKPIYTDDATGQHNRILALHSQYNPGNMATLESIIVERFTEQYRGLLDLVCFNGRFNAMKAGDRLRYVMDHYDLKDIVREYDTSEQVPSWVCESYMGWDVIRKMREVMKKKIEKQKI